MNKKQFLRRLKRCLGGMSREGMADSIRFFDEAITERMEHGETEETAVAAMGSPEEAAGRIFEELPLEAIRQIKSRRRFMRTVGWPALIIGFPVWVSLLAAGASVVIALAASYLAVVVSVFAAGISAVAAIIPAVYLITVSGTVGNALMCVGAALACAGMGILFMAIGIALSKLGIRGLKNIFGRKRGKAA